MEILLVIVVLLVVGFIFFTKNNQVLISPKDGDDFPYFKIQALLTPAELSFYHVLKIAISKDYDIFAKVRLADLISVNKGMDRASWGKAFNKVKAKHIDFVLCDKKTSEVLCAIELDDQSHSQVKRQQRDEFVTKALSATKIPFARFDVTRTYPSDTLRKELQLVMRPEEPQKIGDDSTESTEYESEQSAEKERTCPKCNADLVLRKVARGKNKGKEFWGCSNFPQCRHMSEDLKEG